MIKKVPVKTRASEQVKLVCKATSEQHNDHNIGNEPYVIDVWGRSPRAWLGVVPCLTRNFGQAGGFYILSKARTFTVQELCKLQGLPTSLADDARRLGINDKHLGAMLGHASPVPVLRLLIGRAMHVLLIKERGACS